MKSVIKKSLYSFVWLALMWINFANAAIDFEWDDSQGWAVDAGLKWSDNDLATVINNWISYLTNFLYLIAIIMMLYGWFNILTAGWDEEKVKKWKTILIQAVTWLIVVFIANSIVTWVITALFGAA